MAELAELTVGKAAQVSRIEGQDEIALRLLEMGLTPGTEVRLIGKAPLGDPIEIDVRGYRLSLRLAEARRVQLQPSP
jgi:ferrous iron transport protein A